MNLGVPELLILFLPGIVVLVLAVWAIVDAAGEPRAAWDAVGSSKATWITLIAVFTLLCGIVGLVLAIVYLASIRPKLDAARA